MTIVHRYTQAVLWTGEGADLRGADLIGADLRGAAAEWIAEWMKEQTK